MNREPDLPGDSLGQRRLLGRPGSGLGAVECEHSDQLVEDDEGHREDSPRSQGEKGVTPPK